MHIQQAKLEDWYREKYFIADTDISGSGVEDFSLADLKELIGITNEELDQLVFHDSPTPGSLKLRQAIAEHISDGDHKRVMVSNGSTEAIFLVMNTLLEAGDEVVVLDPCYWSFDHIAASIGCTIKRWKLREDQQFTAAMEDLDQLLSPSTRMLIVNFPHNPTGATLSKTEQAVLIEKVKEIDAYFLWDAALNQLSYENPPLPDVSQFYAKAISFGTLSKAYGLPGIRLGWALAAPEILQKCIDFRDYTSLSTSPLLELIAQRTIEKADRVLSKRLAQAKKNLEILTKWVDEHREYIQWAPPKGGVTGFIYFKTISDVDAFCQYLLDHYGVLLVPGSCFNRPDYARLGFGTNTKTLETGLRHLSQALKTYTNP